MMVRFIWPDFASSVQYGNYVHFSPLKISVFRKLTITFQGAHNTKNSSKQKLFSLTRRTFCTIHIYHFPHFGIFKGVCLKSRAVGGTKILMWPTIKNLAHSSFSIKMCVYMIHFSMPSANTISAIRGVPWWFICRYLKYR